MLILCAGLLPGAQIAERAGGLSPSWPGPRCARPRAHAPGTQRPAPLRVRRARAHRFSRLRAARDIHSARLLPWQARDGRGARGCAHARARVKPPGWCLCAASVRRVRVLLCEFTNPHTNTHKNTARTAENALELTIDLRGGGVAVEEWMRGGRHGGKGENTGSERGGESARCRGCQGDAPRGPGARCRRRGGRLLAVRRRPKPAKTRRAAAQSEAGRGAGEWVGFKVQGVG